MTNESLYLLHFLSTLRELSTAGMFASAVVFLLAFMINQDLPELSPDCERKRVLRAVMVACSVVFVVGLLGLLFIPDYLTLEKMLFLSEAV